MRISFNWLSEFVELSEAPADVGERLTEAGLTLDALEKEGDDTILDLDITSNRGDCLSHLGVAREVAAVYGRSVRMPETAVTPPAGTGNVSVSIEDSSRCRRYTARIIEGVQVAPSPGWMAERLASLGVRPINNIADVTNYVLLELGQPLHAFDLDLLDSRRIVVRQAETGESIETLDEIDRPLDPSMLTIADGRQPVALAGIMGGRASEISSGTRNVLVESAWFDPLTVRQTSHLLNLSTEASYRFERGTDVEMVALASDRATRLILDLAGGTVSGPLVDVYPGKAAQGTIELRRERILRYLGVQIPDREVTSILESLRFVVASTASGWQVTAPSYRHDISREEDLLEEVARQYGYDRFPSTLPVWKGDGRGLEWQGEEHAVRAALLGMGYSEVCTLAFSDPATERRFAPGEEPLVLGNPLSEDEPILRTSMIPSLLRAIRWNLNRGIRDLRLYEIGKVYPARGESRHLVLAMTGNLRPPSVHGPALEGDFFALKGDIETLLELFGPAGQDSDVRVPDYYHPGRSLSPEDGVVFGELQAGVTQEFKIRQRVCLAEIRIEPLYRRHLRAVAVNPIPKYPRIRRDFSLLIDREVRFSDVRSAVLSSGIAELMTVVPFDRLSEGPFPKSCYSLAIAVEYQAPDRTLTDAEVDEYDRRVLARLEIIGAKLRSES